MVKVKDFHRQSLSFSISTSYEVEHPSSIRKSTNLVLIKDAGDRMFSFIINAIINTSLLMLVVFGALMLMKKYSYSIKNARTNNEQKNARTNNEHY